MTQYQVTEIDTDEHGNSRPIGEATPCETLREATALAGQRRRLNPAKPWAVVVTEGGTNA